MNELLSEDRGTVRILTMWRLKVAMGTLAFERGVSTLGQQLFFRNEFAQAVAAAKENGAARDPRLRQRLAKSWMGLEIMRLNALRMLSQASSGGELGREAMISKLYWSEWHRELGELAMDVLGDAAEITEPSGRADAAPAPVHVLARRHHLCRLEAEIQRNLIGERALGLPPEPNPPKPRRSPTKYLN